jgi:Glycine zipper
MTYVKVLVLAGGVAVLGMLGAEKLRAQPSPVDCDQYAQDYARNHSRNGQVLRGAGGGALLGAGIGALAGGAGTGAAIGAGVGALTGASGVRPMHREYTITRTVNAWLVVPTGDFYEKN